MEEVDINKLIDGCVLKENIPININIIGKIDQLYIVYKYSSLDLSRIECNKIIYKYKEAGSILRHNLPNLLKILCCFDCKLRSIPKKLPNTLVRLDCSYNQLTKLPNLPNSLEILDCCDNKLTSIPDLPNSLVRLACSRNKLITLPNSMNISDKVELFFYQYLPISYIPDDINLKLCGQCSEFNIDGYPNNPITNQEELDEYLKYKLHKMNRIKSARK